MQQDGAWRIEVPFSPESFVLDDSQDFQSIDFRPHPELSSIDKGDRGVLLVETY